VSERKRGKLLQMVVNHTGAAAHCGAYIFIYIVRLTMLGFGISLNKVRFWGITMFWGVTNYTNMQIYTDKCIIYLYR